MQLRNRFTLIGIGVLIFVLVAPVLVFYARGFTFDWETKQIVKTGSLVIRTSPDNADIYLNGELQDKKTPAVLRFLIPADYEVIVKKEGFQPWTKRLAIRSQLVTWANSNRPYLTLFLNTPKLISVENNLQKLPDTQLSAQRNNWIIENNSLKQLNLDNGNKKIVIDSLPTHSSAKIIPAGNFLFLILDKNLYWINEGLEPLYSNATHAHWNTDASVLIINNSNEILTFDPPKQSLDLIHRTISNISHPKLSTETGYMFFASSGKIKAIEMDGRDQRNIYTITEAMDDFALSKDGRLLYVFSQSEIKIYEIR